ncbi:MAG: hypothetical protein AB7I27_11710 [Bacteriovoracaceae bacterium]
MKLQLISIALLSSFLTLSQTANATSSLNLNPNLGAYMAKAYVGHDASHNIRAGTCAIRILEKTFDRNGNLESVNIIYKSSRTSPKLITLKRVESGELVGSPFNDREAYTSENPVIEMIGSENSFGILISTNKTEYAAAAGMDGDRQCHNFEKNPMTDEEFDRY